MLRHSVQSLSVTDSPFDYQFYFDDTQLFLSFYSFALQLLASISVIASRRWLIVEVFSCKLQDLVVQSAAALTSSHCEAQSQQISKLETVNAQLTRRLDEVDTQMRQDNLVFYGLPEAMDSPMVESLEGQGLINPGTFLSTDVSAVYSVIHLCRNHLGVEMKPTDISYAYRANSKAKTNTRPIVVRFVNRTTRN